MIKLIETLATSLLLVVGLIVGACALTEGYTDGILWSVGIIAYCVIRYAADPERFA